MKRSFRMKFLWEKNDFFVRLPVVHCRQQQTHLSQAIYKTFLFFVYFLFLAIYSNKNLLSRRKKIQWNILICMLYDRIVRKYWSGVYKYSPNELKLKRMFISLFLSSLTLCACVSVRLLRLPLVHRRPVLTHQFNSIKCDHLHRCLCEAWVQPDDEITLCIGIFNCECLCVALNMWMIASHCIHAICCCHNDSLTATNVRRI